MAPVQITEDFYMVLEVEQTATIEVISRSYKRLALKRHPDRNAGRDTTAAFQLLGKAYETLKDESKRRAYDLLYPTIKRGHASPATPRAPPAPNPQPQPAPSSEALQISKLEKSKQERRARWWTQKSIFESAISKLQGEVRGLEEKIKSLEKAAADEAVEEAWKKSWSAWVLSPIYKQAQLNEEEKATKERKKQERRIEKDLKERRLLLKKAELEKQEKLLKNSQGEIDSADRADDYTIRTLQAKIRAREAAEREERLKQQREAAAARKRQEEQEEAKRRKREYEEWEKRQREATEAWEKRQREATEERDRRYREAVEAREKRQREVAEELRKRRAADTAAAAAARKRQEEQQGRASWTDFRDDDGKGFSAAGACVHDGWWPKVQGRTKCPECHDTWNYLLECPECKMKACPKCQSTIRPRRRNANRR